MLSGFLKLCQIKSAERILIAANKISSSELNFMNWQ